MEEIGEGNILEMISC